MTTMFDVLHKAISSCVSLGELNVVHDLIRVVKLASGQLISSEVERLQEHYDYMWDRMANPHSR